MRLKISREEEAANRLERIQMAIEKRFTGNIETGEVFNRKGKLITAENLGGYVQICFNYNGKLINLKAHHFIYYLATGIVDYGQGNSVDHNNRIKTDNRITNLSIESHSSQMRNREWAYNAKGCYWIESIQRWVAKITVNGELIYLGCFKTEEEGHQAFLAAKEKYHIIQINDQIQ